MHTIVKRFVYLVALGAAICVAPVADAGLFRAYLSANGNDANPCTVTQPCRLLPAALAAVNDGGEIWIVDSANYNTSVVGIGKSVTILAIPGALASLVSNNGSNAINVYAAGVSVTLRNLSVLSLGDGSLGTNIGAFMNGNGAKLTVENCEFYVSVWGWHVAIPHPNMINRYLPSTSSMLAAKAGRPA